MSEECLDIEVHKLQKTKTSFFVVLPQRWIKELGWRTSQHLILIRTESGIIIKALGGE